MQNKKLWDILMSIVHPVFIIAICRVKFSFDLDSDFLYRPEIVNYDVDSAF